MSKRTGTAAWSESRGRWEIKVMRDGVQKRFTCITPGRAGQRIANAKADAWLDGRGIPQEHKRIRVEDAIDGFKLYRAELVAIKRREPVPQTVADIKGRHLGSHRPEISLLQKWLGGEYKTRWLNSITDGDIQYVLDKAAAAGLKKKSIMDLKAAIFQLLKFYRKKGAIDYRPDEVEIPAGTRSKGHSILQPESLIKLFSSDYTLYKGERVLDRLRFAYRFEVMTGLRPGELMGADFRDVDWEKGELHIRRSINVDGYETQGKNDNAIRTCSLIPLAMSMLKMQRLATGRTSGQIFYIPTEQTYRQWWYRYCDYNEIPRVTPYELRHTFVSVVQALPEGLVRRLVGHSKSMDTFGTYGHDITGCADKTVSLLSDTFNKILTANDES